MTVGYMGSAGPAAAQADDEGCRIYGRVIDADLGGGIAGVSVWLERSGGRSDLIAGRTTAADGTFLFEVEECRTVRLRAGMLGFRDAEELIEFAGGAWTYEAMIRLQRTPLEVEELRVEVPRSLRLQETGFYARKAWVESTGRAYANFYDPDEVSGRSESLHTVGAIAMSSRIRFTYGGCRPSVYVDGRRIPGTRNFWQRVDRAVKPSAVEGIEIYRSISAAVPLEFRDYDSSRCGAVIIWTKDGAR